MITNCLTCRLSSLFVAVFFGLAGSIALAQQGQPPKPDGDPVDAAVYAPPAAAQQASSQTGPRTAAMVTAASYRSDSLGGDFLAQWMFINQGGRRSLFWGARITSLDRQSPLRGLGLQAGDVVTRLDDIRIESNMFRQNHVWQMPELLRHFGATDVRFIKQGTQQVQTGQVALDNFGTGSTGPTPIDP